MKTKPNIKIEYVGKLEPLYSTFLSVRHEILRLKYENGEISDEFNFDSVTRRCIDASVILAYKGPNIFLRSAVRPALRGRGEYNLWELPAGLIEPDESPAECARRETEEELGFALNTSDFKELGSYTYPSVGLIGERIYFFELNVTNHVRGQPSLDGSPLEKYGEIIEVPIEKAMELIEHGELADAKTELGIRRFYDKYCRY